jgi:hypothetical protein
MQNSTLPVDLSPDLCYLGTAVVNHKSQVFGILKEDRRKHLYILGKTGMGKTTLLENMILQDIYNGYGVCFLDPHGDSSEFILNRIPKHRQNDVVYLNPADLENPVGLNILESDQGQESYLIASSLMAVFYRIWAGTWSSRMEYILNNTLLALLETPGNTLLGVIKMLTDDQYREKIVSKLQDPLVKNFWQKEFANFNSRYRQEAISPILNKIGQFFSSELMRNILGQTKSTINLREIMDGQKILIVNLSKGRLGEDNSNLFGSLLVAKLQVAAMSRVDTDENKRQDFFLYVDEFQNFTTDSFSAILSEARKYRLNLILAHQYISQLTESGNFKVKNAIFGNVGSLIAFRLGSSDASEIAKEFQPRFLPQNLISLDPAQIAVKLSVRGRVTQAFLGKTLAPVFAKLDGSKDFIIEISRQKYSVPRQKVASQISEWFEEDGAKEETPKPKKPKKKEAQKVEPNKKIVERSEHILSIQSQKVRVNRLKIEEELKFSKKLSNAHVKSERVNDYKPEKDNSSLFELPG